MKRYPSFTLGPLDLNVDVEVLGVLGPSGSGKTTLLSVIAGTTGPTAGRVRLDGDDLAARSLETRGTARVFQESALFPHLTARENLAYAAATPDRTEALAARLEIDDILDQPARTLSGGEGRRVEVARALAADPDVLLLDEPTAGLDTPVRRRLREHLRDLLTGLDIPVLYVTHNQEEVAVVADRVVVMRDGGIQQRGTPAAVFGRPKTPFVARFTGNPNVLAVRRGTGTPAVVPAKGGRLALVGTDTSSDQEGWLCIRPEEIDVGVEEEGSPNIFAATIEERLFDGGVYVLTLRVENEPSVTLDAHVLPPTYRTRTLAERNRVYVHLPPEGLHVIPGS